jgi:bacterioferritin
VGGIVKGRNEIVSMLNHLLAGELTAIDQYLIHGEMYADMGFKRIAQKALHESEHEKEHAQAIIRRILFLEGRPDLGKRETLQIGATAEEMITSDLNVEYKVAKELKEAIALCETLNDYVTRDMLLKQLQDTEMDHAYYLEKQLKLIKSLGIQNYLQNQLGSDGSMEDGT